MSIKIWKGILLFMIILLCSVRPNTVPVAPSCSTYPHPDVDQFQLYQRICFPTMFILYTLQYNKTSLTTHLHRATTHLYRSPYYGPKPSPIQIIKLPKPTTFVNGPIKVGPIVSRFREGLLYVYIYIYIFVAEKQFTSLRYVTSTM